MKKQVYYNYLYDYYKELLTEKQRNYFEEYYFNDFSLQEIGENENVSRNAVFNQVKSALEKLEEFESKLKYSQDKDIKAKMTTVGPHRDDFCFYVGGIDIRKFGSQGQQRTAALSLKLSEIELVKRITKDTPILLLDDVLSELDNNRQNYLLNSIGDIQTIITCTGLEEFVNNRFEINKVYKVTDGVVTIPEGSIEREEVELLKWNMED